MEEACEILGQREKAMRLIARSIAHGYHTAEFKHDPELAALRNDPSFQPILNQAREDESNERSKAVDSPK